MKVRTFITTGDEILLSALCDRYGCQLEIGGPLDHTNSIDGFERPQDPWPARMRTDFMVVYIICDKQYQLIQLQTAFTNEVLNES